MGIKLIRNEVLTVFVMELGVFLNLGESSGNRMGVKRVARVRSMSVFRIRYRGV